MLKSAAYSIASSLANLFNTSLAEGRLPSEWKLARVVPVPKSDAQNPLYRVTGQSQSFQLLARSWSAT